MDRNFLRAIFLLPSILIIGTLGYGGIEKWRFLDSLYMTIITMATIGYNEVHPLTDSGKLFTIFFVIFGVVPAWGFLVGILFKSIMDGNLQKLLGSRKMEKEIKKLKDHYIVCGYGRIGQTVCAELKNNNVRFIVIEQSGKVIDEIAKSDIIYIHGSCADDTNLIAAGIDKAKGLINTVADEADAVYVTLSAKQLNPHLFIMARADSQSVHNKLKRAGATKVLSPHIYAGVHMAQTTLRPNVVDFMNLAAEGSTDGLKIEEVAVKKDSKLVGQSLKDSGIRSELGITVIGAKKKGKEMYYNPPADTKIDEGDTLILIGTSSQLAKLEAFTHI